MKRMVLISLVVGLAAGSALGDMINTNRPIGDATSLSELQGVFTAVGSTIDAVGDQTKFAIFEAMAAGSSTVTYVATISYFFPGLEFGLYEYGNTDNRLKVLDLTETAYQSGVYDPALGAKVHLIFDATDQKVYSNLYIGGGLYSRVDEAPLFNTFGFYAIGDYGQSGVGGPYFSEDSLNDQGNARFLVYEGKGDSITIPGSYAGSDAAHWYIAAEAGNYPAGASTFYGDFSDCVVLLESMTPVPVPAAMLLGLLGLGTAGLKLRKRA